jgi:hypothetical protein
MLHLPAREGFAVPLQETDVGYHERGELAQEEDSQR